MTKSLFVPDQNIQYSMKEGGPIVVAVAFLMILGGVAAAAIVICGWNRVKSVGVDWKRGTASIVCR
ncbi:MAG TPA: hypothetical protein VFZ48_05780 [Candidatus Saccharimonadales bacterium]